MLSFALIAAAAAQQKKRVAVMNFDYSAVTASVTQLWGTNQDVGKGVADMLVDKLVEGGAYSVIERKMLDKILSDVGWQQCGHDQEIALKHVSSTSR
jgi:curli biogenesis system outer membrane secretion channel CsgG